MKERDWKKKEKGYGEELGWGNSEIKEEKM